MKEQLFRMSKLSYQEAKYIGIAGCTEIPLLVNPEESPLPASLEKGQTSLRTEPV